MLLFCLRLATKRCRPRPTNSPTNRFASQHVKRILRKDYSCCTPQSQSIAFRPSPASTGPRFIESPDIHWKLANSSGRKVRSLSLSDKRASLLGKYPVAGRDRFENEKEELGRFAETQCS